MKPGPINFSYSYGYPSDRNEEAPPKPWEVSNFEAEAALLGAMMIANDLIPMVAELVAADDFYEPLHGRIFRTILKFHDRGAAPTPVLLRSIFENDPDMKTLSPGGNYLAMLTGSGAAIIGTRDFAEQIAELAVRRKVAMKLKESLDQLGSPMGMDGEDTLEGLESIDKLVSDVTDTAYAAMARSQPLAPKSAGRLVRRVRERQSQIMDKGEPAGAMCRSVPDLNKVIGAVEPETLNVIGGRPGMCKTTLAMTAAWGYAIGGDPSIYLSAEMTDDQMAMRQAADISHAMKMAIPHLRIRKGDLTAVDRLNLEKVEEIADTIPLEFVATGGCDIKRAAGAVARAVMRWKMKGRPLKIVWIDYLQKYKAYDERGRKLPETEAMNVVLDTILGWNKRFGLATFALSQLGRQVEDRKDHRPQLNDLKQSGNIEQDADSVTLLYREEYYLAKERPKRKVAGDKEYDDWEFEMRCVEGQLELIGEKNRHGKPRTRTVKFIGSQFAIRGGDFNDTEGPLLAPELFDNLEDEEPWVGTGR